jgi:hypothetical protein
LRVGDYQFILAENYATHSYFSYDKLPKAFHELVKEILKNNNDNISYAKKWYCFIC